MTESRAERAGTRQSSAGIERRRKFVDTLAASGTLRYFRAQAFSEPRRGQESMKLSQIIEQHGLKFEERAPDHDRAGTFVAKTLAELKDLGAYKAMIPTELGGGGASYSEMCHFLKDLARYCPSSALTLSMHQHLLAVQVFKYHADKSSEPLLRNVAEKNLVLLSTGGGDWLSSNGSAVKVDGGYEITCKKSFCSGAEMADIAIMSCAYVDGDGEHVLHFGIPLSSKGVTVEKDWDAMGMRGTGSHTVSFDKVFVPEEKIVLKRPRGKWHPVWEAVCTYAHPLFLAPYVGVAERIADKTVEVFKSRPDHPAVSVADLGRMQNELEVAKMAWSSMVDAARNFATKPTAETANHTMMCKSLVTKHGRASAQHAMEALGGYSYFTKVGIERLYRDLLAGEFHPLQASKQAEAMGHFLTSGLPVAPAAR